MYKGIKKVAVLENYELALEFEGRETRRFDMKPLLEYGRFAELKDPEKFAQVMVSFDSIAWPDDLDLDPEYLYESSIAVTE